MITPYTGFLTVTDTGLTVTGHPDFDIWLSAWQCLRDRDALMPWVLGDMLNYGESAYGNIFSGVDAR